MRIEYAVCTGGIHDEYTLLQLLGRADNVKEFVRRGETEGLVEVTLASGESKPIVVSRSIRTDDATGGLSDWKLNGQC